MGPALPPVHCAGAHALPQGKGLAILAHRDEHGAHRANELALDPEEDVAEVVALQHRRHVATADSMPELAHQAVAQVAHRAQG